MKPRHVADTKPSDYEKRAIQVRNTAFELLRNEHSYLRLGDTSMFTWASRKIGISLFTKCRDFPQSNPPLKVCEKGTRKAKKFNSTLVIHTLRKDTSCTYLLVGWNSHGHYSIEQFTPGKWERKLEAALVKVIGGKDV